MFHCDCPHVYKYFEANEFCLGCEEPEFDFDDEFCEMTAYDQHVAKVEACKCKNPLDLQYEEWLENNCFHDFIYFGTSPFYCEMLKVNKSLKLN